jgi:hypothetical protein
MRSGEQVMLIRAFFALICGDAVRIDQSCRSVDGLSTPKNSLVTVVAKY